MQKSQGASGAMQVPVRVTDRDCMVQGSVTTGGLVVKPPATLVARAGWAWAIWVTDAPGGQGPHWCGIGPAPAYGRVVGVVPDRGTGREVPEQPPGGAASCLPTTGGG